MMPWPRTPRDRSSDARGSDPEVDRFLSSGQTHTHAQRMDVMSLANAAGSVVIAVALILLTLHLLHRQDVADQRAAAQAHQNEVDREAICAVLNSIPPGKRTPAITEARDPSHFNCDQPGPRPQSTARPSPTPSPGSLPAQTPTPSMTPLVLLIEPSPSPSSASSGSRPTSSPSHRPSHRPSSSPSPSPSPSSSGLIRCVITNPLHCDM